MIADVIILVSALALVGLGIYKLLKPSGGCKGCSGKCGECSMACGKEKK